jgi:hypothetical protein
VWYYSACLMYALIQRKTFVTGFCTASGDSSSEGPWKGKQCLFQPWSSCEAPDAAELVKWGNNRHTFTSGERQPAPIIKQEK